MDWSQKEENGAAELWGNAIGKGGSFRDALRAVMSRAVELVAARGGDSVPSEADLLAQCQGVSLNEGAGIWRREAMRARAHAATQGATVATLQTWVKEMEQRLSGYEVANTALRSEVERLKVEAKEADLRWHVLDQDRLHWKGAHAQAESILAAIRGRFAALECDAAERANLRWVLEGEAPNSPVIPDSSGDAPQATKCEHGECTTSPCETCPTRAPQEAKDDGRAPRTRSHARLPDEMTRYPCSLTCTHDDAAKPGHPERIASLSTAFDQPMPEKAPAPCSGVLPECSAGCPWHGVGGGRPERVKERSEAFTREAVLAFSGCQNDRERICYAAGREGGLDEGAEAMRAACLKEVRHRLEVAGALDVYEIVKAAIGGAAP